MKRILTALLLLCLTVSCLPAALAEGADIQAGGMPAEIRDYFADASFKGSVIAAGAVQEVSYTAAGSYYFAVVQKNGTNTLYCFKEKNGKYAHSFHSAKAIPQGKGGTSLQYQTGSLLLLSDNSLKLGDAVLLIYTRPEYEEQGYAGLLFEVNKSGVWNVRLVLSGYLWDEAVVKSDSVTYYNEGQKKGTAYGTVQTDLRYFSFSSFPKTLKEGRNKLSAPPELPSSNQLQATSVKFTGGKKYAVYSGPGEKFLRGANGKATVSTNDWIQVFGIEDNWIMIQYNIDQNHLRFGWIPASALPKNASVGYLRFNDQPAVITSSVSLTDDPLKSQTALASLPQGKQVTWLATMGEWAYVQDDQNWVRGFVPLTAISQGVAREYSSQPLTGPDYMARGSAYVNADKTADITVLLSAPAEWRSSPRILRYQVYANNSLIGTAELESASAFLGGGGASLSYRAAVSIPQNVQVLGLCPVYAEGVKTEEAVTIFVGP